jgi:hypothetical protein
MIIKSKQKYARKTWAKLRITKKVPYILMNSLPNTLYAWWKNKKTRGETEN